MVYTYFWPTLYLDLHVNCSIFLCSFSKIMSLSKDFRVGPNTKFRENLPSENSANTERGTGGHDVAKRRLTLKNLG